MELCQKVAKKLPQRQNERKQRCQPALRDKSKTIMAHTTTHLINEQEMHVSSRSETNYVVLNYLIFEGYEATAVKFAQEMGLDLETSESVVLDGIRTIEFRRQVKLLMLQGDIQLVIDKLKLEYPDLLEKNEFLHFKLLLLNLIEMIKAHNETGNGENPEEKDAFVTNIIMFARKKLTTKAMKNEKFMEELELAMTLMLYCNSGEIDQEKLPEKLRELLESKLRRDIADLINKSVLLETVPHLLEFRHNDNKGHDDQYSSVESFYFDNNLFDSDLKKLVKIWLWGEAHDSDSGSKEAVTFEL